MGKTERRSAPVNLDLSLSYDRPGAPQLTYIPPTPITPRNPNGDYSEKTNEIPNGLGVFVPCGPLSPPHSPPTQPSKHLAAPPPTSYQTRAQRQQAHRRANSLEAAQGRKRAGGKSLSPILESQPTLASAHASGLLVGSEIRRTLSAPRKALVAFCLILLGSCVAIVAFRFVANMAVDQLSHASAVTRHPSRYSHSRSAPRSHHADLGSDLPDLHFVGVGAHERAFALDGSMMRPNRDGSARARRPAALPPNAPPLQKPVEFGRLPNNAAADSRRVAVARQLAVVEAPIESPPVLEPLAATSSGSSMLDDGAAAPTDIDMAAILLQPKRRMPSFAVPTVEPTYAQLFDGSGQALDPLYARDAVDTPELEARAEAVGVLPLPLRRVRAIPGAA